MKKNGILNGDITRVLGYMRHTDIITIVDSGFPIPEGVECIDLSVSFGLPLFLEVLKEVAKDLKVELAIFADEIKEKNPKVLKNAMKLIEGIDIKFIPHTEFKIISAKSKAIIRTGEATPFANIILQSGCIFEV